MVLTCLTSWSRILHPGSFVPLTIPEYGSLSVVISWFLVRSLAFMLEPCFKSLEVHCSPIHPCLASLSWRSSSRNDEFQSLKVNRLISFAFALAVGDQTDLGFNYQSNHSMQKLHLHRPSLITYQHLRIIASLSQAPLFKL